MTNSHQRGQGRWMTGQIAVKLYVNSPLLLFALYLFYPAQKVRR